MEPSGPAPIRERACERWRCSDLVDWAALRPHADIALRLWEPASTNAARREFPSLPTLAAAGGLLLLALASAALGEPDHSLLRWLARGGLLGVEAAMLRLVVLRLASRHARAALAEAGALWIHALSARGSTSPTTLSSHLLVQAWESQRRIAGKPNDAEENLGWHVEQIAWRQRVMGAFPAGSFLHDIDRDALAHEDRGASPLAPLERGCFELLAGLARWTRRSLPEPLAPDPETMERLWREAMPADAAAFDARELRSELDLIAKESAASAAPARPGRL